MPMGDNIREEEQAKVDGLRAVNRMLREQNRVLAREYTRLFNLAKPIATLLQDLKIIPIGCSREQELAWKMAVKNFRHYQQGYEASVAIDAALTATSQPVSKKGDYSHHPAFDEYGEHR